MKITAIRSSLQTIPLRKPYTIAYNTFTDVTIVMVELELANGMIGLGAASPAEEVVGETPFQTATNLQHDFVQQLVGRDIRHFQQLIQEVRSFFPHLPGTQAALDIALHDAFAKFLGIPIVDFYGQKIKSLLTSVTIGIKGVTETIEEAEAYQKSGFRILKVKTGLQVEEDIERVTKLYERFGRSMLIRVDANQGYTMQDLQQFIPVMNKYGIELIEQPLPVGKDEALLVLDASVRNRLAGDESIKDPAAALQFCHHPQPFGIFNIKLMKCGGIYGAMQIANIAAVGGISLFWGCNDESIIGISAALHTAYACENTRYLDLDGSFDLAEAMLSGGFRVEDGYLYLTNLPGLGVTISK